MTPTIAIIVALIGAIATIISPILGFLVSRWSSGEGRKPISKERRNALEGIWEGQADEYYGQNSVIKANVRANLKVSKKKLLGNVLYSMEFGGRQWDIEMSMVGGFLFDRYIQLNYNTNKEGMIQFGSAVLEFKPSGTELIGIFAGYGSVTDGLVTGKVRLSKKL